MVNVIMVVLDTLRFDYASKIPVFQDLVGRGWWFERMYAPSTFTNPVICSVRSGMYPPRHGWRTWPRGGPFRKETIKTLGDFLRGAGYVMLTEIQAPVLTNERSTLGTIYEKIPSKRPFFLYLHCWRIHHACFRSAKRPKLGIDERFYLRQLPRVNAYLTKVMSRIKSLGLLENTLWVIFGDHGIGFVRDKLTDKEVWDVGAGQIYDFRVRVPCIVFGPGIKPQQFKTAHSLVDILPTMLDLLDIQPNIPDGFLHIQGHSVLREHRPPVYMEAQSTYSIWPSKVPNVFGATDGYLKVMVTPEGNRCYDLIRDPQEKQPYSQPLDDPRVVTMSGLIDEIRNELGE